MEPRIVREILKKNESFLRRHLVLSKTVLDQLHDKGLVTDIVRRKILMYPTYKQVPLLIESLENQGLPSLRKFLVVLKNTGHGYLVDHILDTEAIPVGDVRPDTTQPRAGGLDYVAPRPAYTVHSPRRALPAGGGTLTSLGSLLKMRKGQETETRGLLNPRTLLVDPVMTGYSGHPGYGPPMTIQPPARREDVPGTLYSLGQVLSNQSQENDQALVVLRQEELAIKQLMEQNSRDQQKVRRKQHAMDDVRRKLQDIHARANDMYEPAPHPSIGKYRLAQLNQIPWSVDK